MKTLTLPAVSAVESFVRRNETVRVLRAGPPWLQLSIAGPRGERRTLRFASEQELRDFQQNHEEQFIREGWRLLIERCVQEDMDRTTSSAVLPVMATHADGVEKVG